MKERHKAVPAVYVILRREGKILVARRCNTGYQDGNYNLPSGHVEEGELPIQAMIREAKEEIGIDLAPESLVFSHIMYRAKHDSTGARVDYFFTAERWSGEVSNAEPHKCDDLRWVSPRELPENTTPHVRRALEDIEKGISYSELDVEFFKKHALYLLER